MKKVIVGISGGIDSALTAYQFIKEGYNVIGVHLQVLDTLTVPKQNLDKIGEVLGIQVHIVDVSSDFANTVLETFRRDHLSGQTPSPCTTCNPSLKWKTLNDISIKQGAEYIASGHYINKVLINKKWFLEKGTDPVKDQSYFLWQLNQEILSKIITPLGKREKREVKELAAKTELSFLLDQKESTGLCFAQGLSYPDLLKKYIPELKEIPPGDVLNTQGEMIGKHSGYPYYTVGQKKGIEYFDAQQLNLAVYSIDAKKNQLIVDCDEALWINTFRINQCFFTDEAQVLNHSDIEVKVRGYGRNPEGFGKVIRLNNGSYQVQLENPAWAMAPGQPVVFYRNNYLLGGGLMFL
jgi:tRNA-specific 2-thiouridylase